MKKHKIRKRSLKNVKEMYEKKQEKKQMEKKIKNNKTEQKNSVNKRRKTITF